MKEQKEISNLTGVITIETRKFCFAVKETAFGELYLRILLDAKTPSVFRPTAHSLMYCIHIYTFI